MDTNYKLVTDTAQLRASVDELSQHPVLGFDTETTSLDPYSGRIRLVQLAAPNGNVHIFDLDRFADNSGTENGDSVYKNKALAPLKKLLADARPVKIAHNAKFDAKWVKHQLGVELGGLFDTLLASQLVSAGNTEDRHSLETVAARYLDERVDKAEQLSDWSGELSAAQLEYAARDAAVLVPLRERLVERLKAEDLIKCATLEFDCVLPVAGLELAGFYLDQERWREQITNVEQLRARLAGELQEMLAEGTLQQASLFGETRVDFNIDSHVQLTKALKRLGVPVPDSTRNWKLQPLAEEYPVVKKLLEYRTVQKSLTSYGENILDPKSGYINPHTGRIHANFHQIGAPTGRFACTQPNIQQVPHAIEYRRCFRAEDGNKLVIADYCVVKGTRVATARGLVPIEKVLVGDRVCLEDESKASVAAVIRRGLLPVSTVTLKNGYTLTATALHRIRVLDGEGNYVWRRIGELQATDFVAIQMGRGLSESDAYEMLPSGTSAHFNEREVATPCVGDERLALFLGYMTGDGSFARNTLRWVVNDRDAEIATLLNESARDLFGLTVHERGRYRGVIEAGIYSTTLARWCAQIGAAKDRVPDFLWSSKSSVVAAYLRGLFEADGSVTNSETGKVSFASSRHRLAREVHQLLLALGIPATLREQTGTGPEKRFCCWMVYIVASGLTLYQERIGFLSRRKESKLAALAERWTGKTVVGNLPNLQQKVRAMNLSGDIRQLLNNTSSLGRPVSASLALSIEQSHPEIADQLGLRRITHDKQLFLQVVSIERAGEQEVFDLSVPGPMTYLSNGFVSHNSQIELRILAHVTGDQGFIDAFNSGADLHRVTAAQVFNVPLDEVTADQRSFAKRLNFGVVYGIGAQRFSMMTGLSLTESEDILRRYFATYRALDAWLREAARRALRERTARTLSNRLARFNFDPADKQAASLAQRNGKNMPIQGSSADILKRALRLLHDKLRDSSARIVNIVHDEIVVEVDAKDAEGIAKTVEDTMCAAGAEYVTRVPIKVETEIADEWVK